MMKLVLIFPDFKYSPILNIHIWLKKDTIPDGFFGLINSPVHWVFNKGTHLNIVISDAETLVSKSDDDLIAIVKAELKKFFLVESGNDIRLQNHQRKTSYIHSFK